jgi:hypothetical protein
VGCDSIAAAAAAAAAALGFTAWTHLCLWPAFQCFLWQAALQYHDSRHLEQHLGAPFWPQHSQTFGID